jgi:hypothetical protein
MHPCTNVTGDENIYSLAPKNLQQPERTLHIQLILI